MARLSFQDKLALMMTSAGSQRNLAALIGVSHQKVGRWLTIGQTLPNGDPSRVKPPTDPATLAAVEQAWRMHVDVVKAQARRDRIPYMPDAPAFAVRRTYRDGKPGQRVVIEHAHRMSDALRARTVVAAHKSRFYYAVTAQSIVARVPYWWLAEARIESEGTKRDIRKAEGRAMWRARQRYMPSDEDDESYDEAHEAGERVPLEVINTPMTPISQSFPGSASADMLENYLQTRHAIATGDKGTELASALIFQTDSAADEYGVSHDIERKRKYDAKRQREYRAKQRAIKAQKAAAAARRKQRRKAALAAARRSTRPNQD